MPRRTLTIFVILLLASLTVHAQTSDLRWRQFHSNPRAFMEQPPTKRDAQGLLVRVSRFPNEFIRNKQFLEIKTAYRRGEDKRGRDLGTKHCTREGVCFKDIQDGRAAARERVEDFIDAKELKATRGRLLTNLEEMEAEGLRSATLPEMPWSDSYWPIERGILGWRYNDPAHTNSRRWRDYFDFVHRDQNSLLAVYNRGNPEEIDNLSPSEKYDLIIGVLQRPNGTSKNGFLTPFMWKEGGNYQDPSGNVESWMGICHGWAPASYMAPRPSRAITVLAADGRTPITLYPSDLKGLSSFSWAYSAPPSRFLGGRCDSKDTRRDPETGRILDEHCFDTNPGSWHIAITNQIGIARRSLIIDATYDYEVWNQPVYSYQYRYFNPQTGQSAPSLQSAIVPIEAFSVDKFKRFRSPQAKFVVGIFMDVKYIVETDPDHETTNSSAQDAWLTAEYMYDLELDKNGRILGGEWYSNGHPDFLWSPEAGSRSKAAGDARIPLDRLPTLWDAKTTLPKFWADIAVQNAVRTGEPLATIIERLVMESRAEEYRAVRKRQ